MNIQLVKDYTYPTAWSGWGEEEFAAIDRIKRSGRWTMGPQVEAFEAEFAAYHKMRFGIMVNSGSSANLIAVAALLHCDDPLQRGDEVLVPALAWSTTYAPLIQHGLEPVVCDIGKDWNADITNAPFIEMCSLIVACNVLGNPCNEKGWADAAQAIGAYLIVDNCESVGAMGDDASLAGTHGIGNTFSFFYSHQLSAIEGGMILTDNADYAAACRKLRDHGWTRSVNKPTTLEGEYDFCAFGYNVRPVEMHAAIAREQLKKLETRRIARSKNYHHWYEATRGMPIDHPKLNGDPSFFGIHFAVDSQLARTKLASALRAHGIDCRPPAGGSFLCHPYAQPWRAQHTPAADDLHYRGLFIGNPPFDGAELIDRAVHVMKETL